METPRAATRGGLTFKPSGMFFHGIYRVPVPAPSTPSCRRFIENYNKLSISIYNLTSVPLRQSIAPVTYLISSI